MDINEVTYAINGVVFEVNRILVPGSNQKPARHCSRLGEVGGDGSKSARRALTFNSSAFSGTICLRQSVCVSG